MNIPAPLGGLLHLLLSLLLLRCVWEAVRWVAEETRYPVAVFLMLAVVLLPLVLIRRHDPTARDGELAGHELFEHLLEGE